MFRHVLVAAVAAMAFAPVSFAQAADLVGGSGLTSPTHPNGAVSFAKDQRALATYCTDLQTQFDKANSAAAAASTRDMGVQACGTGSVEDGVGYLQQALKEIGITPEPMHQVD